MGVAPIDAWQQHAPRRIIPAYGQVTKLHLQVQLTDAC